MMYERNKRTYEILYSGTERQKTPGGSGGQEQEPGKNYDGKKKEELTEEGKRIGDAIDDVVAETEKDMKRYEDLAEKHTELGGQ